MNIKNKKQLLIGLMTIIIASTGCAEKDAPVQEQATKSVDPQTKTMAENNVVTKPAIVEVSTPTSVIVDEQTAISYFDSQEEAMSSIESTEAKEEIQAKVTEYLKTTVDFVFEGKEINGVTFNELSNEAKVSIVDSIETTNEILEDSGLKDIAIVKGTNAKEWTLETVSTATEATKIVLKDLMGEETYQKAEAIAKEAKERTEKAFEDVKKYLLEKE